MSDTTPADLEAPAFDQPRDEVAGHADDTEAGALAAAEQANYAAAYADPHPIVEGE